MSMSEQTIAAIDSLHSIYCFAKHESDVATRQMESARDIKDYRAADRHGSFANAMRKVCARIKQHCRTNYLMNIEDHGKRLGPYDS